MVPPGAASPDLDVGQLETDLRERVRGEVRFDEGSRALYAADASNYRQVPLGVVIPRDADDVVAAVAACRRHGAPIVSRGGGTSLCGQTCNVAVVFDYSKYMNEIVELDAHHSSKIRIRGLHAFGPRKVHVLRGAGVWPGAIRQPEVEGQPTLQHPAIRRNHHEPRE